MEEEESQIFNVEESYSLKKGNARAMIVVIYICLILFLLPSVTLSYSLIRNSLKNHVGVQQFCARFFHNPAIIFLIFIPAIIFGFRYRNFIGWVIIMTVFYFAALLFPLILVNEIYTGGYSPAYTFTILFTCISIINIIFLNYSGVKAFFKVPKQNNILMYHAISLLSGAVVVAIFFYLMYF